MVLTLPPLMAVVPAKSVVTLVSARRSPHPPPNVVVPPVFTDSRKRTIHRLGQGDRACCRWVSVRIVLFPSVTASL